MKKNIVPILFLSLIFILGLSLYSCTGQKTAGEEAVIEDGGEAAILTVKDNYTTMITGEFEVVEYENGYIVSNDNVAFWYVENDSVWNLNNFAKMFTNDLEYKLDIENYKDLFK